jgi:uncharacterized protein YfaP (DUF2135 family)
MTGSYRKAKEGNRSRFYILLSVVFVIVMLKWGIPFFVNIVAGKGAQKPSQVSDIIPPQAPMFSALPEATNSASVVVEGYTEAGAALDLLVGDKIVTTDKAKDDGSFALQASLEAGANRVQVRATDLAGNVSTSEIKLINYDNKPLELTIISPKDGSEFFGKTSQVVEVKGTVNKPESSVLVNNSFAVTSKDGSFTQRFQLADGNNTIKIMASDKAGNTAEKTITLSYTP